MATVAAVGVDAGGTWIRFKGLNANGRCIWSLKKPSSSVDNLPRIIKTCLKRFHRELPALAVGSRGVWKTRKRLAVKRALKGLAQRILVMSDVEAAWLAAFGRLRAPCTVYRERHSLRDRGTDHGARPAGIIIIAGTGSIAYGRKADGTFARAGGLGPESGDEGSGYWIGKQWILQTGRGQHLHNIVRDVASLAPQVIALARRKDPAASRIVRAAQQELAKLVADLARHLRFKKVPLSWAGSVLGDAWFRRGFFRALHPLPVMRRPARMDAATALALTAMSTTHSR